MDCEELVCNRGIYKEVNPKPHKVLDENDMFTMPIEFPTPINPIYGECLGEVIRARSYMLESHHRNTLKKISKRTT